MDERGLWDLFFATGLPEAYLASREREEERREASALPAFEPTDGDVRLT